MSDPEVYITKTLMRRDQVIRTVKIDTQYMSSEQLKRIHCMLFEIVKFSRVGSTLIRALSVELLG